MIRGNMWQMMLAVMLVILIIQGGCSDKSTNQGDTTPPAKITDLTITSQDLFSVTLTWTSPGDDGTTGQAELYFLRYSTSEITDETWVDATPVDSLPAGGKHGVKNAGESEAKVSSQNHDIIFGCMQNFLYPRIGQYVAEEIQIGLLVQLQRIDQKVCLFGGDLDQADLFSVGVETV